MIKKTKQKKLFLLPLIALVAFGALVILLYQGKDSADTFGQAIGTSQFTIPTTGPPLRALTASDLEEGKGYWVLVQDGSFIVKKITDSSDLIAIQQMIVPMKPKEPSFITVTAFSGFAGRQLYYVTAKGSSLKVYTFTSANLESRTWEDVGFEGDKIVLVEI